MSNFQHPGDEWNRFPTLPSALKDQINIMINTNYNNKFSGAVGYLTAELSQVKLSK